MFEEDELKKKWSPVQTGETRTNGSSTSRTSINGETDGWDKPTGYSFTAPAEKKDFKFNENEGILSVFKPDEPVYNEDRDERLRRVARVNALGDFMKHLGSFAGAGYAPVERRQENKGVLRAFAQLDKMRDLHDARKEKYDDKVFGLKAQEYAYQRGQHDVDYDREYRRAEKDADLKFQSDERIRASKEKAYWESKTTRTNTQSSTSKKYGNGDLLNAELEARRKRGAGSEKSGGFVYRATDGEFSLDADRLTQFYSTLEKNRDEIKKMSDADRKKFGIGDNGAIDKDLEIMIAALTGKLSLNDNNFKRIASKYIDAYRNSDMMKYVLAGSFEPYEGKPEFVPPASSPYEVTGGGIRNTGTSGGWPSALPPLPHK